MDFNEVSEEKLAAMRTSRSQGKAEHVGRKLSKPEATCNKTPAQMPSTGMNIEQKKTSDDPETSNEACQKCSICGKYAKKNCAQCHSAWYCSNSCQKIDWPLHKLLCSKFLAFLSTRPDAVPTVLDDEFEYKVKSTYIVGILFPEQSKKPQLLWIQHRNIGGESDVCVGLREVLGYGEGEIYCRHGQDQGIFAVTNMNAISDCKANMCIATLNAGSPCYRAGNIVVVGVDYPYKTMFPKHRDVSLSDFRLAMEFFSQNNSIFEGEARNPYCIRDLPWIKGVIISNFCDMHFLRKKKYREVELHPEHRIFDNNDKEKSPIAHQMDIPFLAKKENSLWAKAANIEKLEWNPYLNLESHIMMVDTKLVGSDWGLRIMARNISEIKDYSMLVARSDKKDTTAQQVQGFVEYLAKDPYNVAWKIKADNPNPSTVWRKNFCVEYFQSDKFEKHFEALKQKKVAAGELSWANAVPPRDGWTGKYSI